MKPKVTRRQDWPRKLFEFITAGSDRPFKWGEFDCCLFAADAVLAMTDFDPAAEFRGKYDSAKGAVKFFKEHDGVEGLVAHVCREVGFTETRMTMVQRGDVVLYDVSPNSSAAGVCVGAESAFVFEDGLKLVPTHSCRRAWGVGRIVPDAGRVS